MPSDITSISIITTLVRLGLFALVLLFVSLWRLFEKAGKPGWMALVPFFNGVVLLRISGKPGWWLALYFVPVVQFIAAYRACVALAKNFGKGEGFGVGLMLLPYVFFPILADGEAAYAPAVSGESIPKPAPSRRGALFTTCLLFFSLQAIGGVYGSLAGSFPSGGDRSLAIGLFLVLLAGVIGLWCLRKWGAYLFFAAGVVALGMSLFPAQLPDVRMGFEAVIVNALGGALILALLAWAVRRGWSQFR